MVGISHSWNIGISVLKMPILTALGGVWETSKHSLMISNHQISMFCFGKGCGNFFKMATRPHQLFSLFSNSDRCQVMATMALVSYPVSKQ